MSKFIAILALCTAVHANAVPAFHCEFQDPGTLPIFYDLPYGVNKVAGEHFINIQYKRVNFGKLEINGDFAEPYETREIRDRDIKERHFQKFGLDPSILDSSNFPALKQPPYSTSAEILEKLKNCN